MAGSLEALADAAATVSRFVVGHRTLEETLHEVAWTAQESLPAVDAVSVTMLDDGRPTTTAYTDPTALKMDDAQYKTDAGPCLDAYRDKSVFRVDDAKADPRWPEFSRAAREHEVVSSLSLPLMVEGQGLGALNAYSTSRLAVADEDEELGLAFAAQVGVALGSAQAYWGAENLVAQLNQALESRGTIEQAKGILMAMEGVGPDEAFSLLRGVSQRENRKLREVALELVERTQQRRRQPPEG